MEGKDRKKPMAVVEMDVTLRDFAIFQVKLILDGLKDVLAFNLSIVAMVLDVIAGRGKRPRLFYSVMRSSERFDRWLNLHGEVERIERGETEDGLFGASPAGADTLIGQLEQLVRGGDGPDERGDGRAADPTDDGPPPAGEGGEEADPPTGGSAAPHTSGLEDPPARGRPAPQTPGRPDPDDA